MSEKSKDKSTPSSDNQTEEPQFDPQEKKSHTKSKSKKTSKGLSKQQQKGSKEVPEQKPKRKPGKKKQQKQQKSEKQPAVAAKRKPKSKKQPQSKDIEQSKAKVLQYMQKQNRPYNLLNIFDNLHGKIKKPQLQIILNELADEGQFSCKQFGKNKVYFINQDKFNMNMKEVEEVGSNYGRLKQQMKQLKQQNKRLNDQYRKLIAKKTLQDLELETFDLSAQISKLTKKRDYLMNGDIEKVDEEEVKLIEKQTDKLDKQLRKRKKLLKDCLDSWCQITQKKVAEVADIMGIQLV